MEEHNLIRFREFLDSKEISAAILINPATLTWLTGITGDIQTGKSPFEGAPPILLFCDDEITLITSDMAAEGLETSDEIDVVTYTAFTIDEPIAGFHNQIRTLKSVLETKYLCAISGNVGVELNFLPASFMPVIRDVLGKATFVPINNDLNHMRAIKSDSEIEKIKESLKLCDLAQQFIKENAQAGVSEIELWGNMKTHLEISVGSRLPILADLVAGLRTADIGGPPGSYALQKGDAIIADIVPCWNGYWGDNCGTHFVGGADPHSELVEAKKVVYNTLQKLIAAVKPGIKACELDELARSEIKNAGYELYPHHTGHGIGTTNHEEPRIVPYNEMRLSENMVIDLEPGVYLPGIGGIRLEDAVLVTTEGCDVLTQHLKNEA